MDGLLCVNKICASRILVCNRDICFVRMREYTLTPVTRSCTFWPNTKSDVVVVVGIVGLAVLKKLAAFGNPFEGVPFSDAEDAFGFASLAAPSSSGLASSSSLWSITAKNGLLATLNGVELLVAPADDWLAGDDASLAESEAAGDSSVVEPTWNVAGRKKLLGAVGGLLVDEEAADAEPDSNEEGRSMLQIE